MYDKRLYMYNVERRWVESVSSFCSFLFHARVLFRVGQNLNEEKKLIPCPVVISDR